MNNPVKEKAMKETRERELEKERLRAQAPEAVPSRSRPVYQWTVTHAKHGTVEVVGTVRLDAVMAAAKMWEVPWTSIARECEFTKGREVSR